MKKVEDVKKITEEQLEVITNHQKDLNKSLTNIGFLETQKHSLLHEYAGIARGRAKGKNFAESLVDDDLDTFIDIAEQAVDLIKGTKSSEE